MIEIQNLNFGNRLFDKSAIDKLIDCTNLRLDQDNNIIKTQLDFGAVSIYRENFPSYLQFKPTNQLLRPQSDVLPRFLSEKQFEYLVNLYNQCKNIVGEYTILQLFFCRGDVLPHVHSYKPV